MKRKVLVTGASGFVGRNLVKFLAGEDVELHLVLREQDQELQSVSNVASTVLSPDLFSETETWWEGVLEGIDTIVHLAWYVRPGDYLESPKNLDCLVGSLTIAKAAINANVARFVGIGTCFEYDLTSGTLPVSTPLKPLTLYASSKTALFLSLSAFFIESSVDFVWCRLFYLYGEGEDSRRLVPYIRSQLAAGEVVDLGDGDRVRDYMDVKDAVEVLSAVTLGGIQGPVNICSGIPKKIVDLAKEIGAEFDRTDLLSFTKQPPSPSNPLCVVGVPNYSVGTKGVGRF